jgi:hypothetical protein
MQEICNVAKIFTVSPPKMFVFPIKLIKMQNSRANFFHSPPDVFSHCVRLCIVPILSGESFGDTPVNRQSITLQ